eukprot:TRINITY_DN3069_c0_g1_i1.p1 TRINITY_DN3069_c0_g1~~TRINITY_DN3069_c0_g1_i1.p1  ORF type:complete len:441 (+),score=62.02 TRINITY_DN3069_c0_g1_i1:1736-3058(+)
MPEEAAEECIVENVQDYLVASVMETHVISLPLLTPGSLCLQCDLFRELLQSSETKTYPRLEGNRGSIIAEDLLVTMALVFIPLRGQIVSLLITFSTVLAELSALSMALTLNRFLETQILLKCKSVFLYRHCLRLRYITIIIMLSFVALEVFASLTSRTAFRFNTKQEDCISMMAFGAAGGKEVERENEIELISHTCMQIDGSAVRQRLGNMSIVSGNVACSENTLYEYNISQHVMRFASSVEKHCRSFQYGETLLDRVTRADVSDEDPLYCIFYEYNGDKLLVSVTGALDTPKEKIEFIETVLHFDASSHLEGILENVIDANFRGTAAAGLNGRRSMLTISRERECDFKYDRFEGTEVPVYVIAILGTLWVALFVMNMAALAMSRTNKFFDLSDPFFWASIVQRKKSITSRKALRVDLMREDEIVVVSDSNQNDIHDPLG